MSDTPNPYSASSFADDVPPQQFDLGSDAKGDVPVRIVQLMRETRPWVLFFAVLLFIAIGLMLLGAMGMIVAGFAGGQGAIVAVSVVYLVVAAIYSIPAVLLQRYASSMRKFTIHRDQATLTAAIEAQRSFWRTAGIMAIVFLAFYVLAMCVAIGSR